MWGGVRALRGGLRVGTEPLALMGRRSPTVPLLTYVDDPAAPTVGLQAG